jgi:DNA-binding transcriptional regulator YdaS (Cro superfamily)
MTTNTTGAARAVEYFGSQSALARFLKITQPSVSHWLFRDANKVPEEHLAKLASHIGCSKSSLRDEAVPLKDHESIEKTRKYDKYRKRNTEQVAA